MEMHIVKCNNVYNKSFILIQTRIKNCHNTKAIQMESIYKCAFTGKPAFACRPYNS